MTKARTTIVRIISGVMPVLPACVVETPIHEPDRLIALPHVLLPEKEAHEKDNENEGKFQKERNVHGGSLARHTGV
jgi:hypothetical protein